MPQRTLPSPACRPSPLLPCLVLIGQNHGAQARSMMICNGTCPFTVRELRGIHSSMRVQTFSDGEDSGEITHRPPFCHPPFAGALGKSRLSVGVVARAIDFRLFLRGVNVSSLIGRQLVSLDLPRHCLRRVVARCSPPPPLTCTVSARRSLPLDLVPAASLAACSCGALRRRPSISSSSPAGAHRPPTSSTRSRVSRSTRSALWPAGAAPL